MWNKTQDSSEAGPEPIATPPLPSAAKNRSDQAVLGPSIAIEGTLSGQEDFLIEGRVEGEISFRQHSVTVGQKGRVKANLSCKRIFIEGQVEGDLKADEIVLVRRTGTVLGNAAAPRIQIEDGAQFQGRIEMTSATPGSKESAVISKTSGTSATDSSKAPLRAADSAGARGSAA